MEQQPINHSCVISRWGGPPAILACTRFNNKTWQEYQVWKSTNQTIYEQTYQRPLKCIYGCPREISYKKIPQNAKILVIEMNNDENRIMGIGEIQNQTASEVYRSPSSGVARLTNGHSDQSPSKHVSITAHNNSTTPKIKYSTLFSDRNYTRYLYIGNSKYATREEIERNNTADAQYINEQLVNIMPQTSQPQHQEETIIQSLERLLFKGARHMKRGSGITKIYCEDMRKEKNTSRQTIDQKIDIFHTQKKESNRHKCPILPDIEPP